MSLPPGTQDGSSGDRLGAVDPDEPSVDPDEPSVDPDEPSVDPDEPSVQVDLLRADLYRLLDELVHAPFERRPGLVAEFERAWERFKQATAGGCSVVAPGPDLAP